MEQSIESFELIKGNCDDLLSMVNDILDSNKIQQKKF